MDICYKDNCIFVGCNNGKTHISRSDLEQIRKWAEDALKRRYEVQLMDGGYWIYDIKNNEAMAFWNKILLNGKSDAEKLCKRLNEEC